MKISKILYAVLVLFFITNSSFAQSAKTKAKAAEKVARMNEVISSIDASIALTAEQTEKITALQIQNMEDLKALKKSDASKEDQKAQKKAINKAFKKEISKNILSSEQRAAQKAGQKQAKAARKASKGK